MSKFTEGQKVKVIADNEDPESGWVGAIGIVERIDSWQYVIRITEGHIHPEQNYLTWFTADELEMVGESPNHSGT